MDPTERTAKADALSLEAELAAKSSRIADLEARVSLLEAENARLRNAVPKGEPTDHLGKNGPMLGRLEEGLGGNKQKSVDIVGGRVVYDVVEVSDGEEEGMAVDVNNGSSAEGGVLAVTTPRKCVMRVVTGDSDDEDETEDAGEGGGGDQGSVWCDDNVDLQDDDVSITLQGKKRAAARVITSDSEEEGVNEGGRGNDKDGAAQEEEVGVTPSKKRALRGASDSDSEDGGLGVRVLSLKHASCGVTTGIESDEDDRTPIREVVKKMREKRVSRDDGESGEIKGCSTPATRRSARLVKSQSKRARPARRALDFVEPKDYEESEDDSEEDDSMDEFINDADCSENSAEESSAEPEECDSEPNYEDVMASIRGKRNTKTKDWENEPEMLSAFDEHPELCLKAVCALYRKQTEEEQTEKATIVHNKSGFNQIHALRGSRIAEFLLEGDAFGPLKKTVHDLEEYDCYALEFCHKVAAHYSKQLFAIHQNKEDPYFP